MVQDPRISVAIRRASLHAPAISFQYWKRMIGTLVLADNDTYDAGYDADFCHPLKGSEPC
jgi:hypothetical protein